MNTSYPFDAPFAPADAPSNLDPVIEREHQVQQPDDVGFRWYRGADARGVTHVFRFQRGGSVEHWQQSLRSQQFVAVSGPFRARSQTLNAVAEAAVS